MSDARTGAHSIAGPYAAPDDPLWAQLTRRPLMLVCLALLAGMVVAHHVELAAPLPLVLCIGFLFVTVATIRVAPGVAWAGIMAAALALGAVRYETATQVPPSDISHLAGMREATIVGTVVSEPQRRGWSLRFRLRVDGVAERDRPLQRDGVVQVRVPRSSTVRLGDRLRLIDCSIKLPPTGRNPGDFDYRFWLARQGVTALVIARAVERIGDGTDWRIRLSRVGTTLRQRVVRAIDTAMPGRDATLYSRLMVGMVYGLQTAPLPDEIVEQFRRAGTVHLLVVSGAQISMIAMAILGLTGVRSLFLLRWWQVILTLGGVLVLVLIVGLEASVTRALAMFVVIVLAGLTRRDYDVYTAIALSAAIICLIDPAALLGLSFQLTFAATLGVVLLLPTDPLLRADGSRAAPPLPLVRSVLWGTIGAWLMTTPLLAHSFAGFAVAGNVANLINVPLAFLVMLLGFIALPLAFVPPLTPLLGLLCTAARGLLALVMQVNIMAASLPGAFMRDVHLSVGGCVAWYLAVGALLGAGVFSAMRARVDRRLLRLHPMWPGVAAFALASLLVAGYLAGAGPPRGMEVTVLSVGAGQCVVVRTPTGATLMADCGGGGGVPGGGDEVAETTVIPFLSRHGIDRLDVLAISHWDADHYNALRRVLADVKVDLLLMPPTLPDARPPAWLARTVAQRVVPARAGGVVSLAGGVTVEVLSPRVPLLSGTRDDANNNSVVLAVRYGSVRVLLSGDIDEEGVRRLVRDARSSGRSLAAQVLVLPHHGRRLERTIALLDAARPGWGVASCDWRAERYLDEAALGVLESRGIRLLRTDEEGTITIRTDGSTLQVATGRGVTATTDFIAAARG